MCELTRRCEASLILFMLIASCLFTVPAFQAQVEEPIQNFRVIKDFPDVMYAGSAYEAQYLFDNAAGWPVPVAVNLIVEGPPPPGKGEFSVDMKLNGEPMVCVEEPAYVIRSEAAFIGAGSKDNLLVIGISSAPRLQPGTYKVTMELWSLRGHMEAVLGGLTGYVVDASMEADVKITVTTVADVAITVLKYKENPHPVAMPEAAVPKYLDIIVSDPDAVVWPMHVEVTYTDAEVAGIDESSLGLYYWKTGAWHRCSSTGVWVTVNTVWADMLRDELTGTPILIGGILPAPPPPPLPRIVGPPVAVADTTPPVISDVRAEYVTYRSATIMWTTNEPSTSQVEYGTTVDYGLTTPLYPSLSKFHAVLLTGLEALTTYHYRVTSTDAAGNTAVSGDYTFTTLARIVPAPAEFVLSNLVVEPSKVDPGGEVKVSVDVLNIGDLAGPYTVTLWVNEAFEAEKSVILAGGAAETVTFTVVRDVPGAYTLRVDLLTGTFTVIHPAEFLVSSIIISPTSVGVGEKVTISALVANIGEKTGECTVTLTINGVVVGTETVTLAGGVSTTVTFTFTGEFEGEYTVVVDGLTGTFTVTAPPPVIPWMLIVALTVAVVAIGGCIAIIWRRRVKRIA